MSNLDYNTLTLLESIASSCSEGCRVYRGYSGRGMYGEPCIGLVIERSDLYWTYGSLWQAGMPEPNTDSLGLQMILYWPHIKDDGKELTDED